MQKDIKGKLCGECGGQVVVKWDERVDESGVPIHSTSENERVCCSVCGNKYDYETILDIDEIHKRR